jgi:uridine phosphorylase
MKARTFNDLGIAGVMGAVLATRGAAWGLATGIVLCLLINFKNKPEFDVYIFDEDKIAQEVKAAAKAEEAVEA